jgi:midasin
MNPGSDVGKKELPDNIRLKFTEIFVPDIELKSDLLHLVRKSLPKVCEQTQLADKVRNYIITDVS